MFEVSFYDFENDKIIKKSYDEDHEFKKVFLEEKEIQWHCNCSYDRISGLLKSIGVDELEDMIEKDGETEVVCHFCSSHYHFDRQQLEALLEDMKQDLQK